MAPIIKLKTNCAIDNGAVVPDMRSLIVSKLSNIYV